jgi:hypothetical protein
MSSELMTGRVEEEVLPAPAPAVRGPGGAFRDMVVVGMVLFF